MNIYQDIAQRTGGNIYIGVVGPVRTGKSTFIKRFMDTLVIPNIESKYDRERARDELPQSAAGKTVMTTEPKFIPDDAVEVVFADKAKMKVKMIDCVGYIIPGIMGNTENGEPRMVQTPWSKEPLKFEDAAETGTRKVINEHSTIGILVTTDGTVGELPRENYVSAEERVVAELKAIGKPFAIIVNSADPNSEASVALAYEIENKYGAPVALVNCLELNSEDIKHIMEMILLEFPVSEISVSLPVWTSALGEEHWLYKAVTEAVLSGAERIKKVGDIKACLGAVSENEYIKTADIGDIDLGNGHAEANITLDDSLYYRIISELTGLEIDGEGSLVSTMKELSEIRKKYEKVEAALSDVAKTGYGIVMPDIEDLKLEEPEIVRQANGHGVKLRASAPSIHMIKADIETEVNPIVGTEQQSEELVGFMLREFEEDPKKIWESNIFGKTLHELVNEGLHTKLLHMPQESRAKLSETLEKIINEGSSGLICIIL